MGFITNLLEGAGQTASSGLLGIGLGAIAGGINDDRQKAMQEWLMKQQIMGQKEMGMFNQQLAYDMWQKTGFAGQVGQIEKAGFNPALMVGAGGQAGQANATTGNVGQGNAPTGGGEILGIMNMANQNALLKAQTANIEADTKNKEAQAAKTAGVDTELAGKQIANLTQNIKNQQAQEALTKVTTELETVKRNIAEDTEAYQKGIVEETWNNLREQVNIITRQDDIGAATKSAAIQQIKAEAINAVLEGALIKAQTKKAGTSAAVDKKQIAVMAQEIKASISKQLQGWEQVNIDKDKNFIMNKLGEAGIDIQDRGQILQSITNIANLNK